jgi:hypothetical protein
MPADFLAENLKARKTWSEAFSVQKENNFSLRIPYLQNYHSKYMEE